jgi:crotonobetaine/carnitine-CoA ligase
MTSWERPTTFAAQWADAVATRPAALFLRFEGPDGDTREWTYSEFDEVVGRTAATFVDAGVGPERGVHLALTNTPAFVAAWLAAVRLGSWIVPSDPMGTEFELAEHVSRTRPAVGVCATERAEAYRAGVATSDLAVTVIEIDEVVADPAPLLAPDRRTEWPTPGLSDRAAVMFTSGTTGRPKGVEITQANYAFAGHTMAAAAGLGPDDRQLVVLPMFHANAQYYSFAAAIAVGASVALMHTFSASRFVEQVARHEATHASLFAGPIRMILARGSAPDPAGQPAGRLRHCWYAQNITADQYATIAGWLGCRPRQLYGMTETIPAVLTDDPEWPRHDAMGRPTPGCTVALQDDSGADVPAGGQVGEIVVGGERGITLFAGYLDDPATTAASFRDGWFLTGDRARIAADGRYEFDGRRKDVLKVAGENVSVVEVERVIDAHPGVHDVVVVGAPDPVRDEVPVAFVVAAADASNDLVAQLEAWCAARLGKAKRPRQIQLVDELPRTSVGKVRKFLLADAAAALTTGPQVTTNVQEPQP